MSEKPNFEKQVLTPDQLETEKARLLGLGHTEEEVEEIFELSRERKKILTEIEKLSQTKGLAAIEEIEELKKKLDEVIKEREEIERTMLRRTRPEEFEKEVSPEEKEAREIMGENFLGPEKVKQALVKKGLKIELTNKERQEASKIPFSKKTLEMVAKKEWRGERAILWWAPPERFGITMLKLREAFGTNPDYQPCVDNNNWWLKEKFAKEVLPEGWHLTLAEVPDETLDKTYDQQKKLMTEDEILVKPVELMFLPLVNYEINRGERLFESVYARTDTLDSVSSVVFLGFFVSGGLFVGRWYPSYRFSHVGLLLSRKFD